MSSKELKATFSQMAKEITKDVIGADVDPLRQHADSLIHYLYPTQENGAVSVAHVQEMIHYGGIITSLLRGIDETNPGR